MKIETMGGDSIMEEGLAIGSTESGGSGEVAPAETPMPTAETTPSVVPTIEVNPPTMSIPAEGPGEDQLAARREMIAGIERIRAEKMAKEREHAEQMQAKDDEIARLKQEKEDKRAEVLSRISEGDRERMRRVKEVAGKVREGVGVAWNEANLLRDPEGRDIVKDDIKDITDEAWRRTIEAKNKAVQKGAEILKEASTVGVELTAMVVDGVRDLTEFTAAHVNEPVVKALLPADRFLDSLIFQAEVKIDKIRAGGEERKEKKAKFWGRIAGVLEGANNVLVANEFGKVSLMEKVAKSMAEDSAKKAAEAAAKAGQFRDAIEKIQKLEVEHAEIMEAEKKKAEDR
ncbi:MAG: hypothetical protein AAB686_02240, partial [Patescibacteria group bacterium]